MTSFRFVVKIFRDIPRTEIGMRRSENIKPTLSQNSLHQIEMVLDILRMEMLDQLIAENNIDRLIGHVEIVAIIDYQ